MLVLKRISKQIDDCIKDFSEDKSGIILDKDSLNEKCLNYIKKSEALLAKYFEKTTSGLDFCNKRTLVIDALIEYLFKRALHILDTSFGSSTKIRENISILALGGYGRKELCPLSDIDIMFLYNFKRDNKDINNIQKLLADSILYPLWDCGFKAGHSSRLLDEISYDLEDDFISLNSCLDVRYLCGSYSCYTQFCNILDEDFYGKQKHILNEYFFQNIRHKKFGLTTYIQEPDIKNCAGGLRDYQTMKWVYKLKKKTFSPSNVKRFSDYINSFFPYYDFLLKVRIALHYRNEMPIDMLSLSAQIDVSKISKKHSRLDEKKRVESFMKEVYISLREIHYLALSIENRVKQMYEVGKEIEDVASVVHGKVVDDFILREGVLHYKKRDIFKEKPEDLIRVFRIAQIYEASLDPRLCVLIKDNVKLINSNVRRLKKAKDAFRSILQEAGRVFPYIKLMHSLGVLGAFILDFKKLDCLVQREYFHLYTVDYHTLLTIKRLDEIFNATNDLNAYYLDILNTTERPRLLYLALLLHDIGKSIKIKSHAQIGAKMSQKILKAIGVAPFVRDMVVSMVDKHLDMIRVWQKRDINDVFECRIFAESLNDSELLTYLYVLTYCDAKATSDDLWSSYKQSMHDTLFKNTMSILQGHSDLTFKENKKQSFAFLKENLPENVSFSQLKKHFENSIDRYFLQYSTEEISLHLQLISKLMSNQKLNNDLDEPVIKWQNHIDKGFTQVEVIYLDRSGMFYKCAASFALARLNILSVKATSRSDFIAIDTYIINSAQSPTVRDYQIKIFTKELKLAIRGDMGLLDDKIKRSTEKIKNSIFYKSAKSTFEIKRILNVSKDDLLGKIIVEIRTKDELALLYKITKQIFLSGYSISFSKINTQRYMAGDIFYIEPQIDKQMPLQSLDKLKENLSKIL